MDIPIWQYVLAMSGYTLLLFFVHEFFRKYLKLTTIIFILMLLSFPLWISNLEGWYIWGKTFLLLIPITIANLIRLSYAIKSDKLSLFKKDMAFWVIYVALFLNILETSIKGLTIGNYYNSVAGIILCITIPFPNKAWRVDTTPGKKHDFLVDLPLFWCLLYITLMANHSYGRWPAAFGMSVCLLSATLITIIVYKGTDLWLSTRAYTLTLYIFLIVCLGYSPPFIVSTIAFNSKVQIIWGIANLVLHVIYALWWFLKGYKTNNPPPNN